LRSPPGLIAGRESAGSWAVVGLARQAGRSPAECLARCLHAFA